MTPTETSTTVDADYTRADYMAHRCTHEQYYAQYVSSAVKALVKRHIGEAAIVGSTHPTFNDIPLKQWDLLNNSLRPLGLATRQRLDSKGWSLNDTVCIAKEAARQIKAEAQHRPDEVSVLHAVLHDTPPTTPRQPSLG